ncbi:hypothetical protein Hokovirus_1_107 [Hokovirus HKV1]|uniref:Ankyrin repeat protein n=1 Tax=Hokovirus HKV1 TaxID=1977638 RepID=A0A1V0SF11_9VIRU|nr:hypothetical protein Hokovirus_1_107 [Hokovirus HKV1]
MEYIEYIREHPELLYLLDDDPKKFYFCTGEIKTHNFTLLHKLVLETKKHKILENFLISYLKTDKGKKELNRLTGDGSSLSWTPLSLACRNIGTRSTVETVNILIDAGALIIMPEHNERIIMRSTVIHKLFINWRNEDVIDIIKKILDMDYEICAEETYNIFCNYYNIVFDEDIKKLIVMLHKYGYTFNHLYHDNETVISLYLKNFKNINISDLEFLLLYCNTQESEITNNLQNYVEKHTVPLEIYDYFVSKKIIKPVLQQKYNASKYNIYIPYYIYENYDKEISNCIICGFKNIKTIKCKFDHNTCIMCLDKTKYICQGCQLRL